jgi:starvation-inducible outer membrane lipoprotein
VVSAEVRERKRKTRGYRAGFLDPVEMFEKNQTFSAMDARSGSLEKLDYLPPIEMYDNTLWVFEKRREHERKVYKRDDLDAWDHYLVNITEFSREMHDIYIVDPDNGSYLFPNQSYVLLFGAKNEEKATYLGQQLS